MNGLTTLLRRLGGVAEARAIRGSVLIEYVFLSIGRSKYRSVTYRKDEDKHNKSNRNWQALSDAWI